MFLKRSGIRCWYNTFLLVSDIALTFLFPFAIAVVTIPSADFTADQTTPPSNASYIVVFTLTGYTGAYAGTGATAANIWVDAGTASLQVPCFFSISVHISP